MRTRAGEGGSFAFSNDLNVVPPRPSYITTFLLYGAIVGIVVGVMAFLLAVRNTAENEVAGFADLLPFGYAFGAGMIASVNPCGFFMLPSYIAYHLGSQEKGFYDSSVGLRLFKAISLALVATAGFIAIFALVGYIVALGGRWVVTAFPVTGLAIGIAMVSLGFWIFVTHKPLGIMAASRVTVTPRKNLRNVFVFGIVYAVASLSCTLPVFLVVVGSALASRGLMDSFAQFISYAVGMGSILVLVTIGAALFKGAVARSLRVLMPHVHAISILFLVAAGGYITYYWIRFGDIFS